MRAYRLQLVHASKPILRSNFTIEMLQQQKDSFVSSNVRLDGDFVLATKIKRRFITNEPLQN